MNADETESVTKKSPSNSNSSKISWERGWCLFPKKNKSFFFFFPSPPPPPSLWENLVNNLQHCPTRVYLARNCRQTRARPKVLITKTVTHCTVLTYCTLRLPITSWVKCSHLTAYLTTCLTCYVDGRVQDSPSGERQPSLIAPPLYKLFNESPTLLQIARHMGPMVTRLRNSRLGQFMGANCAFKVKTLWTR